MSRLTVEGVSMVRPYRASDYDALVEVTKRAFDGVSIDQNIERRYGLIHGVGWGERKAAHLDADVAANPHGILVWDVDGVAVGYVSCRFHPRTHIGRIPNLAVHPEHQGKGVGRALLAAAFEYLRALGMELVRIETLVQNERCCELYPRLGFEEVARQVHYVMRLGEGRGAGREGPVGSGGEG